MASSAPTFLSLPGELRNQIYAHLLVIPLAKYARDDYREPIYPQILRVCKQIYDEALPILYRQNTFFAHPSRLDRLPQIRRWLDPVAGARMERVRQMIDRFHICMRLECDAHFTASEAETAFNNRDALTIQVFVSQFRGSGSQVLRLFEGVRGVRTVDIYGAVENWPKYVASLRKAIMAKEGVEVDIDRSEFDELSRALSIVTLEDADEDSGIDVGEENDVGEGALDAGLLTDGAQVAVGYG